MNTTKRKHNASVVVLAILCLALALPFSGMTGCSKSTRNQMLLKEKIGTIFNIHFATDSDQIDPSSYATLNKIGQEMVSQHWKGKSFIIEGHTDSRGDAEYNMDLSLRRARSVKAYLATNFEIPPAKLITRGYGESRLLDQRNTSEAHAKNRRVVIIVQ